MKTKLHMRAIWFVRTWLVMICCGLSLSACVHRPVVQPAKESTYITTPPGTLGKKA
jgi:hypothetical protein